MNDISFVDTAPDSNLIEVAAKRTIFVIMAVNRACAISVKRELLPLLWIQLKAVY